MVKNKTYFNWSSGKDASMALYELSKDPRYTVDKLLTSVNTHHDRVSMHGLSRDVLKRQVDQLQIPLDTLELPEKPDMDDYNAIVLSKVETLKKEGFTHSAFGDIFLEDLKAYREKQLKTEGIEAVYPIWKRDTKELIRHFIASGFRAVLICINAQLLDESFIGREIDEDFLNDLPDNVDPCGENGSSIHFVLMNQYLISLLSLKLERRFTENTMRHAKDKKKVLKWAFGLLIFSKRSIREKIVSLFLIVLINRVELQHV